MLIELWPIALCHWTWRKKCDDFWVPGAESFQTIYSMNYFTAKLFSRYYTLTVFTTFDWLRYFISDLQKRFSKFYTWTWFLIEGGDIKNIISYHLILTLRCVSPVKLINNSVFDTIPWSLSPNMVKTTLIWAPFQYITKMYNMFIKVMVMSEIVGPLEVTLLEIVKRYFSEFPSRCWHLRTVNVFTV